MPMILEQNWTQIRPQPWMQHGTPERSPEGFLMCRLLRQPSQVNWTSLVSPSTSIHCNRPPLQLEVNEWEAQIQLVQSEAIGENGLAVLVSLDERKDLILSEIEDIETYFNLVDRIFRPRQIAVAETLAGLPHSQEASRKPTMDEALNRAYQIVRDEFLLGLYHEAIQAAV